MQGGRGDIVSALQHPQGHRERKELGETGVCVGVLTGMALLLGKASANHPCDLTRGSGSEWQVGS